MADERLAQAGGGWPLCGGCGKPQVAGWGTALKPAHEPVILARRPLDGTVAANVTRHGVGALNIDGCRIAHDRGVNLGARQRQTAPTAGMGGIGPAGFRHDHEQAMYAEGGRWPANVVLDEEAAAILDEQTGELASGAMAPCTRSATSAPMFPVGTDLTYATAANSGGGSRFFYVAKADASERPEHDGTRHPTVKPLALMRWLVRLVTPPGGVVLDPFLGSGTTAEAALLEGFDWLGCELTTEYVPLVEVRIARVARGESPGQHPKPQPPQQVEGQLALFDEAS